MRFELSAEYKSAGFRFAPGDVLYGRLRPYLNKVWRADREGICSGEFIVFPESPEIDTRYLAYGISSAGFVSFASDLNRGDRPRVTFEQIANYEIPVPPLEEQGRIAAKLDRISVRLDDVKARLDTVPSILKRFRMSVLSAACAGRLTKRQQPERSKDASSQSDENLDLPELPNSWRYARLSSLVHGTKYGTAKKCSYLRVGHPVLRIPNIGDGSLLAEDMKYGKLSEREYRQLQLETGDLLLIRSNGSVSLVGKTALVTPEFRGFAYAGYLIRLRPRRNEILPDFLNYALASPNLRLQIEMPARSTSGVHNINSNEVGNLIIPVPPLAEQAEIVRRVDALLNQGKALEGRYIKAQSFAEKVMPAIVAKAYRGELVEPTLP